jgi:hypothetical protein
MFRKISILIILVLLAPGIFAYSPALQSYIQSFSEDDIHNFEDLWNFFLEHPNPEVKAGILVTLGSLGKGNQNIIDSVNNYLMELNLLYSLGMNVDYALVSAGITAVMELNDSSSYPVLFSVLCTGYPEVITYEVYGALDLIDGNLKQFLAGVIEKNPPEEKLIAFKAGINSERLSISERGQLMELALELAITAIDENAYLEAMRYAAVLSLASLRWTRANALAIRHYYRVQADYAQGIVPKARLIEAIACLGAVGNSDAALVLGLQLGLINARTNSSGIFDPEITLAIVRALGLIGDNAAFDHLLYASNLSYDDNITAAAREAIGRLKW